MYPEAPGATKPDETNNPNLYESREEEVHLYNTRDNEMGPPIEDNKEAEISTVTFMAPKHSKYTSNVYLHSIVMLFLLFIVAFIYVGKSQAFDIVA